MQKGFIKPFVLAGLTAAAITGTSGAFASGLTEVTLNNTKQANLDRQTTHAIRSLTVDEQNQETVDEQQPLFVTVSIDKQMLKAYRGTTPFETSKISSGKQGHDTPTGIFSILGKRKMHRSNIYSNAPMPFMQRLTWSGIALHESNSVPGYPASHGCVRLPKGFAKSLYSTTPRGTHVVIAHEEVRPVRVDHPSLFQANQSKPELVSLRLSISDYEKSLGIGSELFRTVEKDAPLRIYLTRTTRRDKVRHMQKMLNLLGYDVGAEDGIYGSATVSLVKNYQADHGLRKTGTMTDDLVEHLERSSGIGPAPDAKIYVRQNQTPVFEAPVILKEPKKPLGTHLFLSTAPTATATGWIAVSIASKLPRSVVRDNNMDDTLIGKRIRMDAEDALDNVVIPDNARQFIEARLGENASFAISDNGMGTETGKGTDFIVQTY